jgi:hypothetical protein
MANFKPQVTIITEETIRDARDSYGKKNMYQTICYKTYRELKKNIYKHLLENLEPTISVTRSRRGEWGEWFEIGRGAVFTGTIELRIAQKNFDRLPSNSSASHAPARIRVSASDSTTWSLTT